MKPAIVAVTADGVVFGPDAATLAAWTLSVHETECRECGGANSDSRCPQGQRYADATRPDRSWIPSPRNGD